MLRPKKKITKKEIRHDPLLETIYNIQKLYKTHQKKIWMVTGFIIAVIIIAFIVSNIKGSSESVAANMLAKGHIFQQNGYTLDAIQQYEDLVDEYPNTKSGINALFYLGQLYFSIDSSDKGINSLKEMLEKDKGTVLKVAALEILANFEEEQGNYESAAKLFLDASLMGKFTYSKLLNKVRAVQAFIDSGNIIDANQLLFELKLIKDPPIKIRDQINELEGRLVVQSQPL